MAASHLRIFVNYRREETSGHAGRLYDAFAARFGEERVFMDLDQIEPGLDFTEVISDAVASCDVVIALVGARWLSAADTMGRRRLDSPDDFVRLELEAALARGVRVIPALVQDAEMPTSDQLPDTMRPFARRHAVELSDTRWSFDVGRMIGALERLEQQLQERAEGTPGAVEAAAPRVDEAARATADVAQAATETARREREPPESVAAAALAEPEQNSAEDFTRSSALVAGGLGRHLTIERGALAGSAVVALLGCLAPWVDDPFGDYGYVGSYRTAVILLTIGAIAALAAFTRRRYIALPLVAMVLAAGALALTIYTLVRLWQDSAWIERWGLYVAIVGSVSLLFTAILFIVRAVRDGSVVPFNRDRAAR